MQEPGKHHVECTYCQRTVGQGKPLIVQHRGLKSESGNRSPENDRAVDVVVKCWCLTLAVENRDGDIDEKEQHQERLRAAEVLRAVLQDSPDGAEHERKRETREI